MATQILGGYLGSITSASEIQWEIYRYGPVAASILVDDYFYKFDPYGAPHVINVSDSDDPERHFFYEDVNHLVVVTGWVTEEVVEKGVKQNQTFWIIVNSFGEHWGPSKDGSMKIVMGRDAYGIESSVVTTQFRPQGEIKPYTKMANL